jgi:hypothetical protein
MSVAGSTRDGTRRGGVAKRMPNPFGALLGAIVIVLVALHAICIAMIVDRALAHALTPVAISLSD